MNIIIPARKNSQRCHNKLLRCFYHDQNLVSVCASKYRDSANVYIAAYEDEFRDVADEFNIGFIKRSRKSAAAEDAATIHEYLSDFKSQKICMISGCTPFLAAKTTHAFINSCQHYESAVMVKRINNVIMNSNGQVINKDIRCFNSKLRKPFFMIANAGYIFGVNRFLSSGVYWDYKLNDPAMFEISEEESIDIDTELDFKIAQIMAGYQQT